MNDFEKRLGAEGGLQSIDMETIQVNLGLKCNQRCAHCHVGAGPDREEMMDWPTMELVCETVRRANAKIVDLTGGAPEINPHFRRFVEALRGCGLAVQVRTNLTVMLAPGQQTLPEFLAGQGVTLVASMPCYLEENVDAQRGAGAYGKSVEAIRRLNRLGYGREEALTLDFVYNPAGPTLAPDQSGLEADYKRELGARFGIVFNRLLTITNMPIGRFRDTLRRQHGETQYMKLLCNAFNPATTGALMCRHQISVGWDGTLYDCDFNLALELPVDHGATDRIEEFDKTALAGRRIVTGEHCFGCTAGCGSSCGGALA